MTYWKQMFIDWNRRKRLFHELPFLHVDYAGSTVNPPGTAAEYKDWIRTFSPKVKVTNYGRTPAFVHDWIITAEILGFLHPTPPPYVQIKTLCEPQVLEGGKPKDFIEYLFKGDTIFTEENITDLLAEKKWLFVYGVIRFSDFMGNPHEKRFVWMWLTNTKQGYIDWGPLVPNYASQT